MSDDLPKNLRDGRYAVIRLLGEGGQATTFEAVDKQQGEPVTIKRFRVRGAKSWKEVELAEREARVLASLSHPNMPRYVDHFEEQGELFLVTEKIDGENLAQLRSRGVLLSEADVVRLLRDASDSLDYLHGRAPPIVHRDIKPSNVMRRPDGSFALIDFGAVRDSLKPDGGSTVVGTFGYMAPEQFQGRAMPASDVYAVGATAICLLTGIEPEKLPHRGLAIDVDAAVGGKASPGMVNALKAMLEPDPDKRAHRIGPLLEKIKMPREAKRRGEPEQDDAPPGEAKHARHLEPEDIGQFFGEIGKQIVSEIGREIQAEIGRARSTKWEKQEQRREEKAARREKRREERHARRQRHLERVEQRPSSPKAPLGGLLLVFVLLGLTLAQVALTLALRVAVPILLTILSLFFGKGMREAAKSVQEAGKTAVEAVERAKTLLKGEPPPAQASAKGARKAGIRIEPAGEERRRARFGAPGADEDEELAEEEAAEEAEEKEKRRS